MYDFFAFKIQMTCYRNYVIPLQNKPHFLDGVIMLTTVTILCENPCSIIEGYKLLLKAHYITSSLINLLTKS